MLGPVLNLVQPTSAGGQLDGCLLSTMLHLVENTVTIWGLKAVGDCDYILLH